MEIGALIDALSKRAPLIVVGVLLFAVVGPWVGVPDAILNILAVAVGSLAIVLWASKGLALQSKSSGELGFARSRDRIGFGWNARGAPRGAFSLGLVAGATTILTGGQSLAFAGFGLTVVWIIIETKYPADGEGASSPRETASQLHKPNIPFAIVALGCLIALGIAYGVVFDPSTP